MKEDEENIKDEIDAAVLRSALGKFHHHTLIWVAGRPLLYALWQLFYTAKFTTSRPPKLRPAVQTLKVTTEVRKALEIWWEAISRNEPPRRKMLLCNKTPNWRMVDIWRVKQVAPTETTLYVQIPSCSWSRPERLQGTYPNRTTEELSCKLCVWLETLHESLEVMMVPTG